MEYLKYAKELQEALMQFRKMPRKTPFLKDLHYGEMAVFGALMRLSDEKENVSMTEISNSMEISKPALSQVVNKLEDKGYVERIYSKTDRRATYLAFTEKGRELYEKDRALMIHTSNAMVEKLGTEDTKNLIVLIHKLFAALAEIVEEDACKKEHNECQN